MKFCRIVSKQSHEMAIFPSESECHLFFVRSVNNGSKVITLILLLMLQCRGH